MLPSTTHSRAVVACLTPPSSLGMPQFTTALEWKKGRRPAFPAKISTRVLSLPMPPSTGKGFRFPSSLALFLSRFEVLLSWFSLFLSIRTLQYSGGKKVDADSKIQYLIVQKFIFFCKKYLPVLNCTTLNFKNSVLNCTLQVARRLDCWRWRREQTHN